MSDPVEGVPIVQVVAPRHDATNANFPRDAEGRVHHVQVKAGEVAQRILSVGDHRRAALIASLFDDPSSNVVVNSSRGFATHTGTFGGVRVSVVATGMGFPMMDFVVRECRAVVEGPMAILRFGTCGTPRPEVPIGSIIVSNGSIFVRRNPDAWDEKVKASAGLEDRYSISKMVPSNPQITALFKKNLLENSKGTSIFEGIGATADSFYSSQGRTDPHFEDYNEELVDHCMQKEPNLYTLEMETFHLFDLARCSFGVIKASAAAIVLAQRKSNAFLDQATTHRLEREGGRAALLTLTNISLE
eukprot:TRINITY_DN4137_c0_g1_i1.p1 TRINITY_DN4137_c0_g1~~TRINITY_DN4137_c0_g1_i1.p1  ORF type:complete len:302 (-),score=98.48 TRINITY_DN4137_c0_g1_i1:29-934(-)